MLSPSASAGVRLTPRSSSGQSPAPRVAFTAARPPSGIFLPDDFFHQVLVHRFLSGGSAKFRLAIAASGSRRLHRFCPRRSLGGDRSCRALRFQIPSKLPFSSSSSSVLSFFGPSLHRRYSASSLLRPLLTSSAALTRKISPGKVQNLSPRAVRLYLMRLRMTFGLRCSQPARRPHPASLPICVPTVESLLRASFSFTSRLRLAFRYGCRHRLRLAPFIQQDSAHAGHTGARFQRAVPAPERIPTALEYESGVPGGAQP